MMENVKEMLSVQTGVAHVVVSWYNHPIRVVAFNVPTFGLLQAFIGVVNSCAAAGLESAPPRGVRAEVREVDGGGIEFRLVQMKKTEWVLLPDNGKWVQTINDNIVQFNAM